MSAVWWRGPNGYTGSTDGIEWTRHRPFNPHPGYWRVAIAGWGDPYGYAAVIDDFGNLVQVEAPAPQLGSMS